MEKVGILNVTGYAGAELARLLYNHPEADLVSVTGRSEAGKKLAEVFPHLVACDMTVDPELGDVDFVFSALPHAASAESVAPLVQAGVPAVDISADFRLNDAKDYAEWYGGKHPAPDLLPKAAYGLTELNRKAVEASRLIANPGCYSGSALLALAPAATTEIIGPDIIIDSKSGVSGAGRGPKQALLLGEAGESISAYGLKGHRHWPEIVQELRKISPGIDSLKVTFTPHLVPMTRGILSTCYAPLLTTKTEAEVRELYEQFYSTEPFVRIVDAPPSTKQVRGTNACHVYPTVDQRTDRLVVVSVLDNLVKGAAGQAIQNMNLMLGLPETMGIDMLALYP